ncbi:MAG: 1-acyl-sn-glycerol-3-phosphate acyltransferase [Caldilinea sp.]|nr:1-acyl-sn-glycerol-3-phosphate acyltransferase [Caldilinea sp.]HRW47399.1 lysophospholipid acyltransferase family protein [Caldilinea sp.]
MPTGIVPPPKDAIWTWKGVHLFMSVVKPIFCRLAIEGREHIPPQGGCVLTCNHTMGPDFLVISYLSPRQIYFMVKAELMDRYRWFGRFLAYNGCFPIHRGDGDKEAITHAVEVVTSGHVLGMFPEGTRSRSGKLQRGRTGAAYVAIQAQAPVIPAVVINSEPIFHRSNYLSMKPRIAVTARVGAPIHPPTERDDRHSLRRFTREIMDAMADMLPAAMRDGLESEHE